MSYFNVSIVTRDTTWVVSSVDFIRMLQSFMNDEAILTQMIICAKRDSKVVWFWQNNTSSIEMCHVSNAGGIRSILENNCTTNHRLIRAYECHYAKTNTITPTLVTDASTRDFDRFLEVLGISPISKTLTGFSGPLNKSSVVSRYELLFTTSRSQIDDFTGSLDTTMHVYPEINKKFKLAFNQTSQNHDKYIKLSGEYIGWNGLMLILKSDVTELSAQDNLLELLINYT